MYSKIKEFLAIKRATQKDGTVNPTQKAKGLAKINRKSNANKTAIKKLS